MTLRELIDLFRLRADDQIAPYLWDDAFLVAAANRAENEAAERAELLLDTSTSAICQVAMTSSSTLLTLDERVVRIKRAKLSGETLPLILSTVDEMDRFFPGWEDAGRSTPRYLILDIETSKVQPYPLPNGSHTLLLHAYRRPLTPMGDMTDEPEIPDRHGSHHRLVNWMLFEAYAMKDSDHYDAKKAAGHRAAFTADFGERTPAGSEWRRKHMGRSLIGGHFA